jgi:hypothetical protein
MADAKQKRLERVRWLAEHGSAEQKRRAAAYLKLATPKPKAAA